MCDSHQGRAQTTLSKCVQVALLRLQDFWLPKIMISGVILPAARLARKRHFKDSTEVVSALAVHIAYAMIAAGHLPLMMPLLWLSILSITVLAAVSWHEQCLHHNLSEQSIRSIVAWPQAISTLIHAASLSGDSLSVCACPLIPSLSEPPPPLVANHCHLSGAPRRHVPLIPPPYPLCTLQGAVRTLPSVHTRSTSKYELSGPKRSTPHLSVKVQRDTRKCSCSTPWSATRFQRSKLPATPSTGVQDGVRQAPLGRV